MPDIPHYDVTIRKHTEQEEEQDIIELLQKVNQHWKKDNIKLQVKKSLYLYLNHSTNFSSTTAQFTIQAKHIYFRCIAYLHFIAGVC